MNHDEHEVSQAWVEVAKNVVAGKYHKAYDLEVESIIIGIRTNSSPVCIKAMAVIQSTHSKAHARAMRVKEATKIKFSSHTQREHTYRDSGSSDD